MGLKVTCGCEATRVTAGERSDTETVTLREARGDGKRAISTSPVAYSTSDIRRANEEFTSSITRLFMTDPLIGRGLGSMFLSFQTETQ